MKKNLLIFIFLVTTLSSFCQPVVKVFAFEQRSLPGTIPAGAKDENGKAIKKDADKTDYFIFLSFKKSDHIQPVEAFIRGKLFNVQSFVERKTPVEMKDNTISNDEGKKILVSKTSNRVIEIKLAEATKQEKHTTSVQKMIKNADVVIAYVWNKKKYYITAKKLTNLEAFSNE